MKVSNILVEQNGQVMIYHAEYNMNNGIGQIHSEPVESMEEGIAIASDEFGIDDGSEVSPGIWTGWNFGEAEIEDDYSEDGPSQYTDLDGDFVIVTDQPMGSNHPAFKTALKQMAADAVNAMADAQESHREQSEYNSDPYAYHGVRQSDF